jgi:hypothetical protein
MDYNLLWKLEQEENKRIIRKNYNLGILLQESSKEITKLELRIQELEQELYSQRENNKKDSEKIITLSTPKGKSIYNNLLDIKA